MVLSEHFKKIFQDRQFSLMFFAGIVMLICNIYLYKESGHRIEPIIRICYCLLFFPMALICDRRWIKYQLVIVAFSILYFNKWYNPTAFTLISVVVLYHPTARKTLYLLYFIAAIICLGIGHRNWAHAVLHFIYCGAIYFILADIAKAYRQDRHTDKGLILNPKERQILAALAQGKMQKEIDFMNKNTVTKHLKSAKDRNKCINTSELVMLYRKESNPN